MESKYNHLLVEENFQKEALDKKIYFVDENKLNGKPPFSIIMPPPNITGKLHLGHAWDASLQDLLIRYKKMNNYNSLLIPGMDHAGIATQSKVLERMKNEKIDITKITKDQFLEKIWDWKDEYSSFIRSQWDKLGLSLDYSKEAFTLNDDASKIVNDVFIKYYNDGLIYKDYKLVNWDVKLKTAISDIEVIYKENTSKFYYIKYFTSDKTDFLEIATTRPETIFGDQAIAMHPNDKRAKKYKGKKFINPLTNDLIPIIFDDYVDQELGSGVLKITPAHDINDYKIAKRHNLKKVSIIDFDGKINYPSLPNFHQKDRILVRKDIQDYLKNNNLLIKIEEKENKIGYSERSGEIIEPLISNQWFLKTSSLAKLALENQKSENKVNFYPARFEKTFINWMESLEDWCISRQLWWGHEIPAYTNKKTNEIYVGENSPGPNFTKETDVLDTWFSSALWPLISTKMNTNKDLFDTFFPTSVLVTGYDIIFFWVSRMIFSSLYLTNKPPFKDVLIHGLIRDENNKKMSKSLGNGIDPMDIIKEYGSDSLRYFLINNSSPGQDLRFSKEKVRSSWNYINKIWNGARFIKINSQNYQFTNDLDLEKCDDFDKWILNKLNKTINHVNKMMKNYEFGEANRAIYNFVWDDFFNNYLEFTKQKINNKQSIITLNYIMQNILKMLHPFIPMVTSYIWNDNYQGDILNNEYPKYKKEIDFIKEEKNINDIIDIIKSIRVFKAENKLTKDAVVKINIISEKNIDDKIKFICSQTKTIYDKHLEKTHQTAAGSYVIEINLDQKTIDSLKEDNTKIINKINKEIEKINNILQNKNFVKKAPKQTINKYKEKLEKLLSTKENL